MEISIELVEKQLMISMIIGVGNFKTYSVSLTKVYSNLSYAFSKSILTAMAPPLACVSLIE